MLLMIDNYDSFTFNLVQYLGELGCEVRVHRNDEITVDEIEALRPEQIVISPGPCTPKEAGISVELVRRLSGKVPILGVCLGHQSIGAAFGGEIVRADRIMHGKTSPIHHDGRTIFRDAADPFDATRYHSLVIERSTLPECLEISAWTDEGEIMGVKVNVLIDTGSDISLANSRFRDALRRVAAGKIEYHNGRAFTYGRPLVLEESVFTPSLRLGRTVVNGVNAHIGDFHIFDVWRLQDQPTLLIGMDVLAQSREMAIDYHQGVVYFRKRPRGR